MTTFENVDDATQEVLDLIQHFEKRGITPLEACALMGMTISCLIRTEKTANKFMETLRGSLDDMLEKRGHVIIGPWRTQ